MTGPVYALLVIAVTAACTLLTRLIPFAVFGTRRPVPEPVRYLGRILPPAIMATLLVYCLRNVQPLSGDHGLPALLGVAVTALLHLKWRNTLLSSACGTAAYMLLIRVAFPA